PERSDRSSPPSSYRPSRRSPRSRDDEAPRPPSAPRILRARAPRSRRAHATAPSGARDEAKDERSACGGGSDEASPTSGARREQRDEIRRGQSPRGERSERAHLLGEG